MNAGWYPDPQVPAQQRYWNGSAWTEHVAPQPGSALAVPQQANAVAPPAYPAYGQLAQPMMVAPKNPALSLIASFFIPGLGSMMNGDVGKGIGILIGWIISLVLTVFFIGIFGVIGFFIWGLIDAYTGAQAWNRRHGILS